MKPVIIIGSGLAGYSLAREFRKLDKQTPLFILTADDGGFYSKPMLSNAFAQGKQAAQLVTQDVAQMAAQLGATIITGTRAHEIDGARKTVDAGAGTFEYGKLVLAVGARPIQLPIEGDAAERILAVNHVDDYAQFRRNLSQSSVSRVTILGAGLIGCEFAEDLATGGHEVTLVDPNPRPLAALAAPALSQGLQSALAERGVKFQLGTTATHVDQDGRHLRVTLRNGTILESDIVLSAVGLRPDLRLAHASGLATARGIQVDAYGRTSLPDVYALGDCAEYTMDGSTAVLPYVAPLMTAARAIARTLSGQPALIDIKPAPVMVKTPSYPLALIPPSPQALENGAWQDTRQGDRTICRYFDGNGLMAGFGVAPQDAATRQSLLAELGTRALDAA